MAPFIVADTPATISVHDDRGAAVARATAIFFDAAGRRDPETTGADGVAAPRPGFAANAVEFEKRGFRSVRVSLGPTAPRTVTLERVLPTIGSVSVATGAQKNQHELPLATSLIDRGTIALSPAATTDRLLRSLPGFDRGRSDSAFTNYGQLRASFSGAGTDRGVVLVDGFPAQDGFGGQIDYEAYPTDEIERAELLRGAGSALYGSGAIGGVLAIQSFAPQTGKGVVPDGRAVVARGTDGSADDALVARAPLGDDVGVSLAASDARFSYADLPPAYASPIDHVATSTSGVTHFRARYAHDGTTLDGSIRFATDHQDEGRTNYSFDRELRETDLLGTRTLGGALARFGYYVRDASVYNLADLAPTKPGALRYSQHVPTDENGFFGTLAETFGPAELEVLVDQRRVDGRSEQYGPTGATQALGTGVALSQGVGLQATLHAKHGELLLGGRADRERYDDLSLTSSSMGVVTPTVLGGRDVGAISPRAALRYDLSSRVALRVSSGGGFRAPYLNELVRGFNVGSLVMAPNPRLVPERSRTDSAGVDVLLGSGRLSFDALETRVTNAIAFVTITPGVLMRRANVDRTQTDGETLSYAQPIGTCTRLRASGTTQYARVLAGPAGSIGKRLTLVPDRSASLGIDGGTVGPISYSVDGSYVGQTYYDDLNTEPLGAALLFGATIRATTASGVSIALSSDNITNQRFLANIDRYGEPLTVGLRLGVPLGPVERRPAGCSL